MRDKKLAESGIRPSYQRLRIYEWIVLSSDHPTADEIYTELVKEIPTLSKTTVYNSLNLFVKNGLIRVLHVRGNETRYDANLEEHGHFYCECCGRVYDFPLDVDGLKCHEALNTFEINTRHVYFKGLCPKCRNIKMGDSKKEETDEKFKGNQDG